MAYELWDTETSNSLASFTTEAEALQAVAEIVSQYRSRRAQRVSWLVLTESHDGQTRVVGRGEELAKQALSSTTPSPAVALRQVHRKRTAA